MSKRVAEKQLDYDNWDKPDEPTERGVFEKADEATIKARNIITARRKSIQPTPKLGLFKSFDAFANKKVANNSPSLSVQEHKNDEYLSKLAILNKEVAAWITKHVSKDPYCILTPIFSDYAKHLASIDSSSPKSNPSSPKCQTATNFTTEKPSTKPTVTTQSSNGFNFTFGQTSMSSTSVASSVSKPPTFSFGLSTSCATPSTSSAKPTPPAFSFGISTSNATTTTVTPSAPLFTFNPKSNDEKTTASASAEDEEYVPPKPEVKEIKEEGSVYTARCKLFYKKVDQWTERGLGNLHIIPTGDEKFQLLIRADTSLGNILLNILVTKDIPMQLQKNNLTFACIPSPPLPGSEKKKDHDDVSLPPRPVPMLVRVKTPDAASDLLKEIDKYRGKSKAE